jgi:predicted AlkP superfamily phosphohydrolase/phosphomutase
MLHRSKIAPGERLSSSPLEFIRTPPEDPEPVESGSWTVDDPASSTAFEPLKEKHAKVTKFTALLLSCGYICRRFFIPRTGEGFSSFPLANFFACFSRPKSPRKLARLWTPAGLALVSFCLGGCNSPAPPSGRDGSPPVLLMAIDGLEWDLLLPLAEAGELPELRQLMERGRFGLLSTSRPTFSPIIWTSIATGKPREDHGIRGFSKKIEGEKRRRLYNSLDRKTKAFWEILSDYGKSVAVVGWWMTYPVEEVNGVMVAQVNTLDQLHRRQGQAILKGGLITGLEGQVHPPSRTEEMLEVHDAVESRLDERMKTIFGRLPEPRTLLTERLWENTRWAFRSDATYVEIATRLATEGHDLVACYLGGADVTAHRFWRYMEPDLYQDPPPAEEIETFGRVIPDYYRFVDSAIGRIRAAMPEETRILVVSDHGMGPVNREGVFSAEDLPEDINSAHHHRAPPGVFIAAGSEIAPSEPDKGAVLAIPEKVQLKIEASVYDIAPTVLALLDVPAADDMKGRVAAAFTGEELPPVPTHDSKEWLAQRAAASGEAVADDPERFEQLRALGYIQ